MSVARPPEKEETTASRPPALSDVARLAAVSHQTVSRVINDHPNVSEATRAKVLAAIDALSYHPNLAARALATGRSKAVGIVVQNTTMFGPASALYSVEEAARRAGYSVLITSVRTVDEVSIATATTRLHQQGVSGVIVIATACNSGSGANRLPADLSAVAVAADPVLGVPSVSIDHAEGARLATQHLLDLGHRTVWHLAGPADHPEAAQRLGGWRRTLEAAHARVFPSIEGDWSAASGYAAGLTLAAQQGVSAIFAANDAMALGLLRALSEQGRFVPEDVSLVGFDNVAEAPYLSPPLTTMAQDFAELGARAVRLLLDRIENGSTERHGVVLSPALIVRSSTAPRRA